MPATAGGNADDDSGSDDGGTKARSGGTRANPSAPKVRGGGMKMEDGATSAGTVALVFAEGDNMIGKEIAGGGSGGGGGGGGFADLRVAERDRAGDGGDSAIGVVDAVDGAGAEEGSLVAGDTKATGADGAEASNESRVKLSNDGADDKRDEAADAASGEGAKLTGAEGGVSECRAEGRGGNAFARSVGGATLGPGAAEPVNVLGLTKSSNARRSLPPFPSDTKTAPPSELTDERFPSDPLGAGIVPSRGAFAQD